jgi:hypothetical protein
MDRIGGVGGTTLSTARSSPQCDQTKRRKEDEGKKTGRGKRNSGIGHEKRGIDEGGYERDRLSKRDKSTLRRTTSRI